MPEPAQDEKPALLLLGARDWDFSGWVGDFYPDDLPESWRLAYYANEYDAVLVPEPRWAISLAKEIRAWSEDVGEGFRFFLELQRLPPDEKGWGPMLACAHALGEGFGGVVCRPGVRLPWDPPPVPLAGRWFEMLDVPPPAGDLASGTTAKAVVAEAAALGGLRAQRGLLEALARGLRRQREIPFFLGGDPPLPKALRELQQLAELMALA